MPRKIVIAGSRDTQELRGKRIDHFQLCNKYLCGVCAGRLVLKYYEHEPHWRTVCFADPGHDPQAFIRRSAYEQQQAEQTLVFDALPQAFKDLMKGELD